MANVPFLTQTAYVPPTPTPSSNAIEDLIDYLNNVEEENASYFLSPKLEKLRKLKEQVDKIFEELKKFKVEEGNSTLKEFAKVYTIKGVEEFDPLKFFQYARQNMTSILKNNRGTKVKMVLICNMERLGNYEGVIQPSACHSNIEVNLDGTDEKQLYDLMIEIILEKIATF